MYLGLPILSKNARGLLSSSRILAALLLLMLLPLSRAKSVSSTGHDDRDAVLMLLQQVLGADRPRSPRNGGLIPPEALPTASNASARAADERIAATAITIAPLGDLAVGGGTAKLLPSSVGIATPNTSAPRVLARDCQSEQQKRRNVNE